MADGPVIVVGGPGSWPAGYRGLAATLSALSGRKAYVVPLTPLDWVLGRLRGYGQTVFEVASTVDGALLESEDDRAILVGHSAGGILARVFIGGDPPYGGRRYSGHRRISHLITLGAPHNNAVAAKSNPTSRVNELFPGALHEHIRYVSVAGAAVDGATSPRARKRYERFVPDGRVAGDGLVPAPSALLPRAEALVLDDLYHGRLYAGFGGRWYGADRVSVERWWPEELRVKGRVVQEPGA